MTFSAPFIDSSVLPVYFGIVLSEPGVSKYYGSQGGVHDVEGDGFSVVSGGGECERSSGQGDNREVLAVECVDRDALGEWL